MAINDYTQFLYNLGAESISLFWMPIAIWTLLALVYLLFLRQKSSMPPQAHYQILTALILALPVGALLAFLAPFSIVAPEALQFAPPTPDLLPESLPALAETPGAGYAYSPFQLLGLITLALLVISIVKVAQLIAETLHFRRMTSVLSGQPLANVSPTLEAVRRDWGIRDVEVFFSDEDHVPMTFGWRKALVVVPRTLQRRPDALHMTLVHELAHIRNADFIRQWIERIIAAFYFFHPLIQSLVNQIDQSREMNCDVEVLSQENVSPKHYASLLLNFASPQPAPPMLSISMSDTNHNLKNRIAAMKAFPMFSKSRMQSRRRSLGIAALLLVCSALIVACEVKFQTDNSITIIEATESSASATTPEIIEVPPPVQGSQGEVFMIVENMPRLIGGLESIQDEIKYPAIAQKAGIEGRVFVQFIVDEQGNVVDPVIVRGIGAGCDEEAIRAVRKAKFIPGRQRGQAVKVKMSIPITFKLAETAESLTKKISAAKHMIGRLEASIDKARNDLFEAENSDMATTEEIAEKRKIVGLLAGQLDEFRQDVRLEQQKLQAFEPANR